MTRILGLGIDIVERARIERLLERHGEVFVRRVFRDGEVRVGAEAGPLRRSAHVAGLFAAKEAAMKALGTGWAAGVGFLQLEVLRLPSGAPELRLHGEARRRADALGVEQLWLSITHDGANAVAVVVLEGVPT
ncbi:MAG: holo-ACP synthase [Thermoanaerobaculia bacterium]